MTWQFMTSLTPCDIRYHSSATHDAANNDVASHNVAAPVVASHDAATHGLAKSAELLELVKAYSSVSDYF